MFELIKLSRMFYDSYINDIIIIIIIIIIKSKIVAVAVYQNCFYFRQVIMENMDMEPVYTITSIQYLIRIRDND